MYTSTMGKKVKEKRKGVSALTRQFINAGTKLNKVTSIGGSATLQPPFSLNFHSAPTHIRLSPICATLSVPVLLFVFSFCLPISFRIAPLGRPPHSPFSACALLLLSHFLFRPPLATFFTLLTTHNLYPCENIYFGKTEFHLRRDCDWVRRTR